MRAVRAVDSCFRLYRSEIADSMVYKDWPSASTPGRHVDHYPRVIERKLVTRRPPGSSPLSPPQSCVWLTAPDSPAMPTRQPLVLECANLHPEHRPKDRTHSCLSVIKMHAWSRKVEKSVALPNPNLKINTKHLYSTARKHHFLNAWWIPGKPNPGSTITPPARFERE